MNGIQGEFVHSVLDEYIALLKDVREHCFYKLLFCSAQANRLASWIYQEFAETVEFPWTDSDNRNSGIFREKTTRKWYAIIMEVDGKRFEKTGKIDVMNVKLDPHKIATLTLHPGYRVCYHMNKQHWISIFLDDTLTDEKIENHIQESRQLIIQQNASKRSGPKI